MTIMMMMMTTTTTTTTTRNAMIRGTRAAIGVNRFGCHWSSLSSFFFSFFTSVVDSAPMILMIWVRVCACVPFRGKRFILKKLLVRSSTGSTRDLHGRCKSIRYYRYCWFRSDRDGHRRAWKENKIYRYQVPVLVVVGCCSKVSKTVPAT